MKWALSAMLAGCPLGILMIEGITNKNLIEAILPAISLLGICWHERMVWKDKKEII